MDAMKMALQQKRMGLKPGLMAGNEGGPSPDVPVEVDVQETPELDLKGLLQSLSPDQKKELHAMLTQDMSGDSPDSGDVEKGGPSGDEKKAIDQEMAEQEGPLESTDEMMLQGQREKEPGAKPRNLSERAVMAARDRMKKKGKM